ncbi:MAG: radical SAM protein [Candidatus Methanomethylicaceae archaeon]
MAEDTPLVDRITLWAVNRLADKVASSVSFSRATDLENMFKTEVKRTALNIRVPFCASRCPFCAFPGELYSNSYAKIFLTGLKEEMKLYSSLISQNKAVVERVYLSGGTPTLLHKEFGTIQDQVSEHFSFQGKVALEASPADLKDEVLASLKDLGISQLSIGVQSFNETLLAKVLGRPAKRENLVSTLKRVMDYGFDYVNIDLMFSLPGQTKEMLLEDLKTAADIRVNGISTYPLMMLPYTALSKTCARERVDKGGKINSTLADQNQAEETENYLAIVNYLRERTYKFRTLWSFSLNPGAYEGPYEHDSFIGLGPRAWGVINNNFTLNAPSTEDYIATLKEGKLPVFAYSELRDYPTARLARRLYYGGIDKHQLNELKSADFNIRVLTGLLRILGLVRWEEDFLKMTDRALAYGNLATKKIAMATLSRMDEILKAG